MYTEYIIIIAIHLRVSPCRPTDLFVLFRFYLFFLLKREKEKILFSTVDQKNTFFKFSSFPCFYPSSTQTDEDHQRKRRGCG